MAILSSFHDPSMIFNQTADCQRQLKDSTAKRSYKVLFGLTSLTYGGVSLRNASSGYMSKSGTRNTHIQGEQK